MQLHSDISIFGRVVASRLDFDQIKRFLLRTFARNILVMDGVLVEIKLRQRIHVVAACSRVKYIRFEHGVMCETPHSNAFTDENMCIVLDILTDLADGRIFENRFQGA